MSFAGEDDRVRRPGVADRAADRLAAIDEYRITPAIAGVERFGLDTFEGAQPLFEVCEDRDRVFRARVVARCDREVRVGRDRLGHQGPLRAVAISAAAEDRDETSFAERAHCVKQLLDRVRGMRVVDQHGGFVVAEAFDALHPTRDLRARCDAGGDRVDFESGGATDAHGDQQVFEVEVAEQRERDVEATVRILEGRACAFETRRGIDQPEIRCGVRTASDAQKIGPRVAGDAEHLLAGGIVDVHDRDRAGRQMIAEEPSLRGQVGVHAAVEIEVILREVREGCDLERAALDPAELEAVRGDLHHRRLDLLGSHRTQGALEVEALGCRVDRDFAGARESDLDGADEADALAGVREDRLHEIGRARLAVRAGDAH